MRNMTLVCFWTMLAAGLAAAAPRDALEGSWAIELTPEEGGKLQTDTIVFKALMFHSTKLKARGFEPAQYETDGRGQIMTFKATLKSAKNGTADFSGTATLGEMTGTMTLTGADGAKTSFAIKGKRQE